MRRLAGRPRAAPIIPWTAGIPPRASASSSANIRTSPSARLSAVSVGGNVQADNRTLKELLENFRAWVRIFRTVITVRFFPRPDRLGALAVADLRLRGLDQRRDPPYRGHARSRPCSPPLRCRSRSAARSSTSRTSTTVQHEQRLDPPPQAAQAERRRSKRLAGHSNLERAPPPFGSCRTLEVFR